MIKRYFSSIVLLLTILTAGAESVTSPNGRLAVDVGLAQGAITYSLKSDGQMLTGPNTCSMTVGGTTLGRNIAQFSVTTGSRNINRDTPFYRQRAVSARCNTLTVHCGDYDVEFAVFDDGAAYRFVTRLPGQVQVQADESHFALDKGSQLWYGPMPKNMYTSFESMYQHQAFSTLDTAQLLSPQVLVELPCGKRLLLSDYNVVDYAGWLLQADGTGLHAVYARYPRQERVLGATGTQRMVASREPYIARTGGTRAFPWKMMLVADSDAQLLTSTVPACLADSCQIADTRWIKPGLVSWEWWNCYGLKGVDFKPGVNTATYKYHIDFASQYHIPYILIDAGWTEPGVPLNLLKIRPEVDLPALVDYGRQRGVGILLWSDAWPLDSNMEQVCRVYSEMGIKGFKIDHMNRNDQPVVDFMQRAAATCARYHLMVDFHGCMTPAGLQFTWPNVVNFEAVWGAEHTKFKSYHGDMLVNDLVIPFIRQVVGPVDYTPGAMRNATRADFKIDTREPMSLGTRSREIAKYVIFEAPLGMLCDSPTSYEQEPACTDFISRIPTTWDETRVVKASVGHYVVLARRKGSTWYIAGMNDWQARDITLDLTGFNAASAILFKDGRLAESVATDFVVDNEVPTVIPVKVHMAAGGGFAMMLTTR